MCTRSLASISLLLKFLNTQESPSAWTVYYLAIIYVTEDGSRGSAEADVLPGIFVVGNQ